MDEKDSGWDLSDLEREIEDAVDRLFVAKKSQTDTGVQPKEVPPAAQEVTGEDRAHPPPTAPLIKEERWISRELQEKIEEVEAQLLTLEWDINSKHINKAINLLQDLRKLPYGGGELDAVAILIQKVLYQLLLDENKLGPNALMFLQKSWKAIKRMTDERFAFDIDKKTLARELTAEFQTLRIEGEAPEEIGKEIVTPMPPEEERIPVEKEVMLRKPPEEARISLDEIKKLMDRIQKLEKVVYEETKRWNNIYKEITKYKDDLQQRLKSEDSKIKPEEVLGREELGEEAEEEEIVELEQRLEVGSDMPADVVLEKPSSISKLAVSLFEASGVIFGLPEDNIMRKFPVRKWVADFFIESGKVKLKDREIPILNLVEVFRLEPSTEENPLVLLIRDSEDRQAAIIVDQALTRDEVEFHPIEGKPYILGKGRSARGEVWILNVEQIAP